jgi:ABC-type transporter Mla maintaining outer membrane lipid asymmetry ATPase subunit MlaF
MSNPVLELKEVTVKAPTPALGAIQSLTLQILPGEVITLVGMRRWEREILADLISAMVMPEEGRVFFKKTDLKKQSEIQLNRLRGRMGIVTDPPLFLNNVRIMENLRLPLRYHSKEKGKSIDEKIEKISGTLGMKGFPDLIPSHFDHRFLGAAALVRALSVSPDLLVLVRPLECLDRTLAFRLQPILKEYVTQHGGAVLVLTTVPRLAITLSDRIGIFDEGRVVDIKTPKAYRASLGGKDTQLRTQDSPEDRGA